MKKNETNNNRFSNFTAEKKLNLAVQLYFTAMELKRAALKEFHPGWDEKKIEKEVKRIFSRART